MLKKYNEKIKRRWKRSRGLTGYNSFMEETMRKKFWITPPEIYETLDAEFGFNITAWMEPKQIGETRFT